MSAAIGDAERDIREHLLRGLHDVEERLAVAGHAAPTLVQHDTGIDQIAMVLDQPLDAVGRATFLVRRERDDDVAIGNVPFTLQTKDVGGEDRRHRLIVGRPATVVVAVLFREYEGIEFGRPIRLECLDDVDVRQKQQRLVGRAGTAMNPRDDIVLLGTRTAHEDIRVGDAGVAKPLRQRESDGRDAAGLVSRIDLDDLFVDLACELLMRGERAGRIAGLSDLRAKRQRGCGKEDQSSFHELLLGGLIVLGPRTA